MHLGYGPGLYNDDGQSIRDRIKNRIYSVYTVCVDGQVSYLPVVFGFPQAAYWVHALFTVRFVNSC